MTFVLLLSKLRFFEHLLYDFIIDKIGNVMAIGLGRLSQVQNQNLNTIVPLLVKCITEHSMVNYSNCKVESANMF